MSKVPSIEALIVSFNTRAELRATLSSLIEHRPRPDVAELLVSVFDNSSSDGSPELVAREFPAVRLARSDVNLGFSRATNELARQSRADYLLLLNSDVILTQDVITPLLHALEGDPRAIVTGPRLVYPGGQVQYSAQSLPTLSYEFARTLRIRRLGRYLTPVFDSRRIIDVVEERALTERRISRRTPAFLWATCWLIRRADVIADGLFDDAFVMYDEDLDFCRRALQRGRSLRYIPTAELTHLGGTSSTTSARKRRLEIQARRRYYRRHHGLLTACAYAVGVRLLDGLARLVDAIPSTRRRL